MSVASRVDVLRAGDGNDLILLVPDLLGRDIRTLESGVVLGWPPGVISLQVMPPLLVDRSRPSLIKLHPRSLSTKLNSRMAESGESTSASAVFLTSAAMVVILHRVGFAISPVT